MTSHLCLDKGEIKRAERTPQGFLRAPAFVTRVGVLTYRLGDGSVRRELRHPDDVFDAASLSTMVGVPVTDDHPNVEDPTVLLLTPANVRDFMVGYTGDGIAAEGEFVQATLTITDAETIAAIEAGKTEISCGYLREIDETPGVYEGVAYDCRQKNIVYNHVAVVDRGRAGPDVRMRLDAADAEQVPETYTQDQSKEPSMETVTLGGVSFSVDPALKAAIEAAIAASEAKKTDAEQGDKDGDKDADKAKEGAMDDLKAKCDSAQAKLDAATAEIAKLRAAANDAAPAAIRAAARTRMRLERVAARTLAKDDLAKLDAMDDQAIKVAVIKAECKGVNLDGKSDVYIDVRFDTVAEALDQADAVRPAKAMGQALDAARADGAEVVDADAARKKAMARTLERSHRPSGAAAAK